MVDAITGDKALACPSEASGAASTRDMNKADGGRVYVFVWDAVNAAILRPWGADKGCPSYNPLDHKGTGALVTLLNRVFDLGTFLYTVTHTVPTPAAFALPLFCVGWAVFAILSARSQVRP